MWDADGLEHFLSEVKLKSHFVDEICYGIGVRDWSEVVMSTEYLKNELVRAVDDGYFGANIN